MAKKLPARLVPKEWESTMTPEEVQWCYSEIQDMIRSMNESCTDNFRAARIWVSSQRRRYRRDQGRGCCGSHDWLAQRWNCKKLRYDTYMLGFNYGH